MVVSKLMEFCAVQVERGSPKSCFLFMGELLCEVNWVSVLSDSLSPQPSPSAQTMVVSVLYLMVFLAKEDLSKPVSCHLFTLTIFKGLLEVNLPWFTSTGVFCSQSPGPISFSSLAPSRFSFLSQCYTLCQHTLPSIPCSQSWYFFTTRHQIA